MLGYSNPGSSMWGEKKGRQITVADIPNIVSDEIVK
jgi:hypothetical protein